MIWTFLWMIAMQQSAPSVFNALSTWRRMIQATNRKNGFWNQIRRFTFFYRPCQVRKFTNKQGIPTAPSVTWKSLRRAASDAGDPSLVSGFSWAQIIHHKDGKIRVITTKHVRKELKKNLCFKSYFLFYKRKFSLSKRQCIWGVKMNCLGF